MQQAYFLSRYFPIPAGTNFIKKGLAKASPKLSILSLRGRLRPWQSVSPRGKLPLFVIAKSQPLAACRLTDAGSPLAGRSEATWRSVPPCGGLPLFVIARRAQPDAAIRSSLFSAFPYRHYQGRTDCHGRKRPRNDKIGLFDKRKPASIGGGLVFYALMISFTT